MAATVLEPQLTSAETLPGEEWTAGRLVLPGGVLDSRGQCFQTVIVRQLTGHDEEVLADRRYSNAAQQVTEFLAQVLVEVPGLDKPVSKELVAEMLIGDRDYLLLRLRQICLGDMVEQVMRCPVVTCGRKADVEFLISELPVRRAKAVQPFYEFELSEPLRKEDPRSAQVVLRLPAGRDLEAILDCRDANPALANTKLFARIIKRLGREALSEGMARALPMRARQEIAAFLKKISPGPELKIEIQCPNCGGDMSYPFDLNSFFLPNG
ncbi:MAG TPA: hypothetical protein VHN74_17725 [Candidatus Angelobacter sp.]|jgi:hypothetical protein|nr:hypothetical protein [Candidatus Angelobacter sp.]